MKHGRCGETFARKGPDKWGITAENREGMSYAEQPQFSRHRNRLITGLFILHEFIRDIINQKDM